MKTYFDNKEDVAHRLRNLSPLIDVGEHTLGSQSDAIAAVGHPEAPLPS